MSENRAVRSSQKFKPTKNTSNNRRSKTQANFKSREKPKYKSGAKPNNRVRDSGRDESKRRPPSRSKDRGNYRSSNRSSARYDNRNRRDSGRGNLELHTVTCDKCKKETQVPFKPTGVKPVYCRECFRDQKPQDRSRSARQPSSRPRSRSNYRDSNRSSARYGDRTRSRADGRQKQLHTVTCDKCKKETQVPFKPTGVKPVYCRACFQDQQPVVKTPEVVDNKPENKNEVVERFGDREGPYRATKRMHITTCRTCNKEIMIPFKPKNKPIYCQDCYQIIDKKK